MIRHEDGIYLVYASDNKTLIGKFDQEKDAQILERLHKAGQSTEVKEKKNLLNT